MKFVYLFFFVSRNAIIHSKLLLKQPFVLISLQDYKLLITCHVMPDLRWTADGNYIGKVHHSTPSAALLIFLRCVDSFENLTMSSMTLFMEAQLPG